MEDDDDRRVVRVGLTDEGRRLIGMLADQRREHLAQLLDDLSDDELAGFLTGVRAVRIARERRYGPPKGPAPTIQEVPA